MTRPMIILRGVMLMLGVCSPLGAQVLGAGYQVARSNQIDMRQSNGLGLRLRLRVPIDLRYDYLITDGQRFDSRCAGGPLPPQCAPETIDYSSRLHSIFIAARARLLSRGSFNLFALPEVGFVSGTIAKRSAATGPEIRPSWDLLRRRLRAAPGAGLDSIRGNWRDVRVAVPAR